MLPEFEYVVPSDLSEACGFLKDHRLQTKVIAGGTDLVLSLHRGELRPHFLLDISDLKEIGQIEEIGDTVRIGASCTHTRIAESPLLKRSAGILSEASSWVGSRQIRNLGTIGGNIANASPAADTVPALMALNARVMIVSKDRERIVPLAGMIKGPYQTQLEPEELIHSVLIEKIAEGAWFRFFRITRRKAMATARINGAVILWRKDQKGPIEEIRISVGSVTPVPCRMLEAENLLRGVAPSDGLIEEACSAIGRAMVQSSGVRKSTEYKQPVVQTLVKRAIQDALKG
jgi:CO/xanthine dehydrogenase FAD-binding subunit